MRVFERPRDRPRRAPGAAAVVARARDDGRALRVEVPAPRSVEAAAAGIDGERRRVVEPPLPGRRRDADDARPARVGAAAGGDHEERRQPLAARLLRQEAEDLAPAGCDERPRPTEGADVAGRGALPPGPAAVARAPDDEAVRRAEDDAAPARVDRERQLAPLVGAAGDEHVRAAERPRVADRADDEVVDEEADEHDDRRDCDELDRQPLLGTRKSGPGAALLETSVRPTGRVSRPRSLRAAGRGRGRRPGAGRHGAGAPPPEAAVGRPSPARSAPPA